MMKTKLLNLGKNILLAVITTIVFLGLLELGFRFYLYKINPAKQSRYLDKNSISLDPIYSPHPYLIYYPTPNYRSVDGLNRHNSLGFRGEEIKIPKPKEVFRIVAIGGSTTYGEYVKSYQEAYPFQLQNILREKYSYPQVEVINAGAAGYNSWESLINFEFRVLDLEPNMIIVYQGTNDVHTRLVAPQFYRGDNTGRRKAWTEKKEPIYYKSALIRWALAQMLGYHLAPSLDNYVSSDKFSAYSKENGFDKVLNDTPMNTLKKNPPIYFERNLKNILAIAKENNVSVLLATWASNNQFGDYAASPQYQFGFQQNNQIVKKVAQISKTPVFDFAVAMSQGKKYWHEGRHLNAEGNRLKAELFAEFIHENGLIPKP